MTDITGHKFNRLTAVRKIGSDKARGSIWLFNCECGNEKTTFVNQVTAKKPSVKSCGCLNNEKRAALMVKISLKHGQANKTRLYRIWKKMMARCNNSHEINYPRYGGRGIEVEWPSFIAFRDDMEKSYYEHVARYGEEDTTLDRIDNDGNYSKANCRWATQNEQNSNKHSRGFHQKTV